MATIAKGVSKITSYAKETQWGVPADPNTGQQLRRVTADFNLVKENYTSNEINPSLQTIDLRHGVRSAEGSISAELSPGTYSDFMASVLARDFTAGGATVGASVTIAAFGELYTVTRAAGSWITDGFYVGNIVRLTGAGLSAANAGNNLLIVSMTATVLTVVLLSGTDLVLEGPIASVNVAVVGAQTYIPKTGHTDDSYTVESFYSDIAQSELYTGLKPSGVSMDLPATGLVTATIGFMGKNLEQAGNTQYFVNPADITETGIFAAVSGAVVVNGVPVGLITSMSINIERNQEAAQVVGSNFAAEIFVGRINLTGSMSVYFSDPTFRDYFDDEAKVSIVVALTTGEEKNADAISFSMPRCKINTGTTADAELGILRSMDYQALQNPDNLLGQINSTVLIQDTTVVP